MTNIGKQRAYGMACVVCAFVMVFCIVQMIPLGMAGEANKVKPYFAGMVVAFVIGLVTAIAHYYYRDKGDAWDQEKIRVETEALAHQGQKRKSSTNR